MGPMGPDTGHVGTLAAIAFIRCHCRSRDPTHARRRPGIAGTACCLAKPGGEEGKEEGKEEGIKGITGITPGAGPAKAGRGDGPAFRNSGSSAGTGIRGPNATGGARRGDPYLRSSMEQFRPSHGRLCARPAWGCGFAGMTFPRFPGVGLWRSSPFRATLHFFRAWQKS